jgi:hypothetical protein
MLSKISKGKKSYLVSEKIGGGGPSQQEIMQRMVKSQMEQAQRPKGGSSDIASLRNSFDKKSATSGSEIAKQNPGGFDISPAAGETFAKVTKSIVKAPISIAKSVAKAGIGLGQPKELHFDNIFEKVTLEGPAIIKGFFSGIGNFFRSIPEALGVKKTPKQK